MTCYARFTVYIEIKGDEEGDLSDEEFDELIDVGIKQAKSNLDSIPRLIEYQYEGWYEGWDVS